MTYTLRVYSRDNEGVSSAIITFMTSTGERGSGLAIPYEHGAFHSHSQLPACLFSERRPLPTHSPPCMVCLGSYTLRLPGKPDKPEVHAQWRENRALTLWEQMGSQKETGMVE